MKRLASALCLLSFSPPLFACDDLPVPITLSGTSFEDEALSVATSGIRTAEGRIYYDLKKAQWCVERAGTPAECGFNQLKFIAAEGPDKGKISGSFRFVGRQAYLYENKAPHHETNFEPDTSIPYFQFFEGSASPVSIYGLDRLTTKVVDKTGTLGQVSSSRVRSSAPVKGIAPIRRLDLRRAYSYFSNCGGLVSDAHVSLAAPSSLSVPVTPARKTQVTTVPQLAHPREASSSY